ncbi:MAG: hypothetical protein F4X75_00625 [Gemmatimonadetes bacterium]|nr:hypothetical protein [Gemmatimonadota bacterium]
MVYQDVIRPKEDTKEYVKIYRVNFLLWKEQWDTYTDPPIELDWQCVKFERDSATKIPTEKGVYAFVVEPRIAQLPSRYVMYIGETGYKSKRHLRKRFRDYLYDKERPKRSLIHSMLTTWEDYLYFYYVEVKPSQMDIEQLEQRLLDTFTPPYSQKGYSAEIGDAVKLSRV